MKLEGGGTTIEVAPFGAMLASARFDLGDGFVAEPFFMNPWSNDKREIEPFLRNLGAEWACVPFGRAGAASDLPDKWHINQDIKDAALLRDIRSCFKGDLLLEQHEVSFACLFDVVGNV